MRAVGLASSLSSQRAAVLVQLDVARVDDHVGVGHLAQLAQLRVGEGGLGGPAAAEHDDLLDAAVGEHVERVVGHVGRRQLVAREGEHPRHVHRHVAVADHDRALAGQVELEVAVVGMAVVPGDELGGRPAAGRSSPGIPMRRSVWAPTA